MGQDKRDKQNQGDQSVPRRQAPYVCHNAQVLWESFYG